MSALLRVMVITLAFLACSQGHPFPDKTEGMTKADPVDPGQCPPCGGYEQRPMGACPCPEDETPGGRVPDFGQNGKNGSHGGRSRP